MKIIQVHNFYQSPTGDDSVVQEEYNLLMNNGHQVVQYLKHNSILKSTGLLGKFSTAFNLRKSLKVEREFKDLLIKERPDLVHVHNIFPLITPVVFNVCQALSIPVVQTLHNYRLLCVNTLFYRDGRICEDCLQQGSLIPGITNKCYNNSQLQSAILADAISHHFRKGTWVNAVDQYFCLSEFAKEKFIQGGIPREKLTVKPNFVGFSEKKMIYDDFVLFAGKLEEQKGVLDFIELAKSKREIAFKVAGFCSDKAIFASLGNVEYLGELGRSDLMKYMNTCKAVLFLSKMYEGMPMTILEAFSCKKAVIARNQGVMTEIITHGHNGMLFSNTVELGDHLDLIMKDKCYLQLGANAFATYKHNYSSERGYKQLIQAYENAINSR